MSEEIARKIIDDAGGKVDEDSVMALPDGSGCFTASFPLPSDHWLTAPTKGLYDAPPMPFRMGAGPERDAVAEKIRTAAKYAIRGSTMNGKEEDFDPDAMVQNMIVGLLGYWTEGGLSSDDWANPNPVPPMVQGPALASSVPPEEPDAQCPHSETFTHRSSEGKELTVCRECGDSVPPEQQREHKGLS